MSVFIKLNIENKIFVVLRVYRLFMNCSLFLLFMVWEYINCYVSVDSIREVMWWKVFIVDKCNREVFGFFFVFEDQIQLFKFFVYVYLYCFFIVLV